MKRSKVIEQLKSCADHYESDDFKSNYCESLACDIHYNGAERILQNLSHGSLYDKLSGDKYLLEQILETICENIEEYVIDFNSWYVGSDSIGSASFGEQEETIEGIEHLNDWTKNFLGDEANFVYVESSGYFYQDLSSKGIHVPMTEESLEDIIKVLEE